MSSSFVDRYAEDFNRLDAKAICGWYEYPLSVLSPQGNAIFNHEGEFRLAVDRLLMTYRSADFKKAVVLDEGLAPGKYGLNRQDIRWQLMDQNDEAIVEFEISYFCKDQDGRVRICGVISHNESAEWKRKLSKATR